MDLFVEALEQEFASEKPDPQIVSLLACMALGAALERIERMTKPRLHVQLGPVIEQK